MKKIILGFLFCSFTIFVFSQRGINTRKDRYYYLDQSKTAKQTGWILLSAGSAAMIIGAVGFNDTFTLDGSNENSGYGFLFLAGAISDLVSIPYFIKAKNYQNLAGEVSIGHEQLPNFSKSTYVYQNIPAIKWRLRF